MSAELTEDHDGTETKVVQCDKCKAYEDRLDFEQPRFSEVQQNVHLCENCLLGSSVYLRLYTNIQPKSTTFNITRK